MQIDWTFEHRSTTNFTPQTLRIIESITWNLASLKGCEFPRVLGLWALGHNSRLTSTMSDNNIIIIFNIL